MDRVLHITGFGTVEFRANKFAETHDLDQVLDKIRCTIHNLLDYLTREQLKPSSGKFRCKNLMLDEEFYP